MKRCHAVVPRTEVKQFCLTVQELNRGGMWVNRCPTAETQEWATSDLDKSSTKQEAH